MRALVTGGGGFLGRAIVELLLKRGYAVRSFTRSPHPHVESAGAETFLGDLTDEDAVQRAVADCDVVFHAAAKAGVWGPAEAYHGTNVIGTRHVLVACRRHGTRKLVYTSSPSVVFDGHDEEGTDETEPYPQRFLCEYARTKALAEQEVLAANGPDLATVALRPHLIWGPGDPHLVPRIVERARQGKLRLVGHGDNRVDSTYVENAAYAHLLAADRLSDGAACAGKAYFVSNGEPLPLRELINGILDAAGAPPITRSVPAPAAYAAGALLEWTFTLLGREDEPLMTRFLARQLAVSHWFDLTAAREDLGYTPVISLEEGFARLRAAFKENGAEQDRAV